MDATMTVDPKAHDEATAALYEKLNAAQHRLASVAEQIHRAAGDKKDNWARRPRWTMSFTDALARVQAKANAHPLDEAIGTYDHPVNVVRRHQAAVAEIKEIAEAIELMNDIYAEHGWQRFFPCNNSNGHIHADLFCHTLNKGQHMTDMGWRPDLSGHTVDEAIVELGTWLCSVCFPDAPAEHCQTRSEATRAEREAKKAAAAEAKYDTNLRPDEVFEDGRVGRSGRGDKVTTVHGAKVVLREVSEFRHYSGINQHHTWYLPTLAAAEKAKAVLLDRESAKPGTGATQEEIDTIMRRAEQRARQEANRR
jgi:hypothetical protein